MGTSVFTNKHLHNLSSVFLLTVYFLTLQIRNPGHGGNVLPWQRSALSESYVYMITYIGIDIGFTRVYTGNIS